MLSKSPFAPRFLSRGAAASSSASVVPEVLFFTGSVHGLLAIRSIRVDCWISKRFTRQTLELPTDRPTNRKSGKKLSDFRERLHVQSRVLVKCDF